MTRLFKQLAMASALAGALVATPSSAQVSGNIAVINAPVAIINTTAFRTAYQQIGTTYATQIQTLQTRQQERQTLLQQLDTNSDGQLDEAEQQAAQNTTQATRLQAIDQEMAGLSNQVETARVYAIEQILQQYGAALQQVATTQNIQVILDPDAVIYVPAQANISQLVATDLNGRVPSVQITPPQGWQPQRASLAMYQQIQQALLTAQALQAQAAQQQQQQQQAPSGR